MERAQLVDVFSIALLDAAEMSPTDNGLDARQ